MLTGTPMKNGRPSQLFPLLAAIDHPIARDQRMFEERYCQGHWREGKAGKRWEAAGVSQLEELRRLTRPLILHRRKRQVVDLPPKQRQLHPIVLPDDTSIGFDHRVDLVVEDYRRRAQLGEVRSDAEPLAVLTAMRQIAAEFKLSAAEQLLYQLHQQGHAVVLFSAFIAPLQLLHQRIGGELMTGRQRPLERQQSVDRFQQGKSNCLVGDVWHWIPWLHASSRSTCCAFGEALDSW
jgi:SNF2 family DNA or RNA helicase